MSTIDNPLQNNRFQVTIIRGHLRCMAKGMTHSKINKTAVLAAAGRITGKKYKRGQYDLAANDLTKWLAENT